MSSDELSEWMAFYQVKHEARQPNQSSKQQIALLKGAKGGNKR
jgi:hypothetical protein